VNGTARASPDRICCICHPFSTCLQLGCDKALANVCPDDALTLMGK